MEGNNQGSKPTSPAPQSGGGKGTGLAPNIASLLCYICGIITGIIFLVLEKENKEVKFHAWQSIFLGGAALVIYIVLMVIGFIPYIGILAMILSIVFYIAYVVVWVIAMVKAYQGEHWLIPVIGNLAEQQVQKSS